MIFDWAVLVGDIIALCSLIGSIIMFIRTAKKQRETMNSAIIANSYMDSAKKYYDMMIDQLKDEKNNSSQREAKTVLEKAYCDANIVKTGSNKWILKIFNKGYANATNVSFKYLVENAPPILGEFPIKSLEPQKNVDNHIIIHLGLGSSSWDYEINWTNEDGTIDSKRGILTLPLI